jgi:hypothetical protein
VDNRRGNDRVGACRCHYRGVALVVGHGGTGRRYQKGMSAVNDNRSMPLTRAAIAKHAFVLSLLLIAFAGSVIAAIWWHPAFLFITAAILVLGFAGC